MDNLKEYMYPGETFPDGEEMYVKLDNFVSNPGNMKYKDLNITRIPNLDLSSISEISQSTKSCTNLIKIRENSEKFDSIKYKKLDNMI